MSKIKITKRSPSIDMTPMVDMFFLLLTFFILTTTFRPQEAVQVDTPFSISAKPTPDANIMTLLVSKDGRVFFNIDNGSDTSKHVRAKMLREIGKWYNISFTEEEVSKFEKLASFGMDIKELKKFINEKDSKIRDAMQKGIPMDSTDNQLAAWIFYARMANPIAEADIKGDFDADYKVVKKVFDLLQDKKINKFNLTTSLESADVKLENKK